MVRALLTARQKYDDVSMVFTISKLHDSYRLSNSCASSPALNFPVEIMAPWEEFESTFRNNKKVAYAGQTIEQIRSNRQALENVLFVDRLLRVLGINAGMKLYQPPLPLASIGSNIMR
jgi:hypothetical protein